MTIFYAPAYSENSGRALSVTPVRPVRTYVRPSHKPCPGHNSLTVRNIFMKLYRCMHDIKTMCHEKGRQLLLVWFLNYLPLLTMSFPYLRTSHKPCPGHNSLIVWNIFMKLYRRLHDIKTMCHEKERQPCLFGF